MLLGSFDLRCRADPKQISRRLAMKQWLYGVVESWLLRETAVCDQTEDPERIWQRTRVEEAIATDHPL